MNRQKLFRLDLNYLTSFEPPYNQKQPRSNKQRLIRVRKKF